MYFAVSMVLVCMSLILAVIVLNVHHRGDIPGKKVPKWIRKCCLEGLWACFRSRGKHTLDKPRQMVTSTGEIPNGQLPLKEVSHHFFNTFRVCRLTCRKLTAQQQGCSSVFARGHNQRHIPRDCSSESCVCTSVHCCIRFHQTR